MSFKSISVKSLAQIQECSIILIPTLSMLRSSPTFAKKSFMISSGSTSISWVTHCVFLKKTNMSAKMAFVNKNASDHCNAVTLVNPLMPGGNKKVTHT